MSANNVFADPLKEECYDILLTQLLSVTTHFLTMEFDRAYKALSNGTFVE